MKAIKVLLVLLLICNSGLMAQTLNQSFLFDFGPLASNTADGDVTVNPDLQHGNYWNNISGVNAGNNVIIPSGTNYPNLINTTNQSTTFGLNFNSTATFNTNGKVNGGLKSPYDSQFGVNNFFAVGTATEDYIFTLATTQAAAPSFKITGLNTSKTYRFKIFGCRNGNYARTSCYVIQGAGSAVSGTLNTSSASGLGGTAYFPTSSTPTTQFNYDYKLSSQTGYTVSGTYYGNNSSVYTSGYFTPNASGEIIISAYSTTASANNYAYINCMMMEEFTPIIASPTITSFTPTLQKNGGVVTISGLNFTGATAISFGGTAATSFTVNSDTQITATVGSGATGNVSVTAPLGTGSLSGFEWSPVVCYDGGTSGANDFWLTHFYYAKCTDYVGSNTKEVAGSDYLDFNGGSNINFTNISVTNAGNYMARLTYYSGFATNALNVSINGGTNVLTSNMALSATPTTFDIPVTLIAGTNTINLTQSGNWPRVLGIQLIGPPAITSFTPTLQKNTGTVTLTGVNFTGTTSVSFGGTAATSFTVNSDTQITATVGTGTSGSVSVTAPLGTGTLAGFEWSPVVCYVGGTSGANDFWLTHFYYAKCTDYVGSNTKEVAGSDYLDFNGGSNINFTNISVTNAGNYMARLTYFSGFATNALNVSVNSGTNVLTSNMALSATPTTFDIPVTLIAGSNSIKLIQTTNWPRVLGIQLIPSQINLSGGNLSTIGISDVQLANTDLTVSSSEFVINATKTVKSLIVAPEAKLTISSGTLTATNGITLQSNSSGTSTLMDNYSAPTVVATVQQYVTAGRNWYMSAPLNNTADYTVLNRGASVAEYNELTGLFPAVTGTLTRGKGYIQVASASQGSTGTVSFNGTTNSGDVPVTLTYTSGFGNGFNLVGNPYPSYLSWSVVAADNAAANMPTGTMWYRTISYNGNSAWAPNTAYSLDNIVYNGTRFYRVTSAGTSDVSGGPTGGLGTTGITDGTVTWAYEGSIYIFATINASGIASPATVNNLVPPMQAFWVRSTGGTITFKNAMRSHNTGGINALKAPKISVNEIQLLRLNVTNGATADEAVIYASRDASNAFDTYDAPKYFNLAGSDQPEIYTQAGNEKLVINALNEITVGTEIPLGFVTEKGNDFTISASEFSNFGSEMQIILKDKQKNTEFNLTSGQAYEFSSDAVNDANRFSIIFRTSGSITGFNKIKLNAQAFVNTTNQIVVQSPEKANVAIYNVLGQKQYESILNSTKTTIHKSFGAGVFFVELSVNGQSEIQKVIIR